MPRSRASMPVTPRTEHDRFVTPADAFRKRLDEVAVAARNQRVGQFDNRHRNAECLIDGRHLEPDDAPADDEQAARQGVNFERTRRIHDPRIVRETGQADRLRARGDDALLELKFARAVRVLNLQRVRGGEPSRSRKHFNPTPPREARQSLGELANDAILPGHELPRIDRGTAELDPELARIVRFPDDARRMQQCLGRNAADVQTHAAEFRPALDERDLHAEIRSAERRRVPPGPGAEHHELPARFVRAHRTVPDRRCFSGPPMPASRQGWSCLAAIIGPPRADGAFPARQRQRRGTVGAVWPRSSDRPC